MQEEIIEIIEACSDATSLSESSSVYLGVNESKNSSNSFAILPARPKLFYGRESDLNHILKLLFHRSPRVAILGAVWEPLESRAVTEKFLGLLTALEGLGLIITMRGAERPAGVQWTHPFLSPLNPLSNNAAMQTFMDITDATYLSDEISQVLPFTGNLPLAVDLMAHLVDYEGLENILSHWEIEKRSLLSLTSESKELLSLLSMLPNGLSDAELVQARLGIPNILRCKATLQATSLAYQDINKRILLLVPVREYVQRFMPPPQSRVQADILESGQFTGSSEARITPQFYRITGRGYTTLMDYIQPTLRQPRDQKLENAFLIEVLKTGHYHTVMSEDVIAQVMDRLEDSNDSLLKSKCQMAAGAYFSYRQSTHQAAESFQKALELARKSGDSKQECTALTYLGRVKCITGHYGAAEQYLHAAQRLSKLSGNLYQEAKVNTLGAVCAMNLGKYQESGTQLDRAAELLGVCGLSKSGLGHEITLTLAENYLLKSEYVEARDIFLQVLESASKDENTSSYASALINIAQIDTIIGDLTENVHHNLDTARELFRKTYPLIIPICERIQATLELRGGEFETAELKFHACLRSIQGKESQTESDCLEQLANFQAWPASHWHYKWPIIYLVHAYKAEQRLPIHKGLLFLGNVFSANHDEEMAANLYQAALEGFTQMDVHHSRAKGMLCLGDLADKAGHTSEAINLRKSARPLFERSLQTKDVAQIDSRLATVEMAHQKALVQLKTLHAPVQSMERIMKVKGNNVVEEDGEDQGVPVAA
ncbi:hypothetical protein K438DRAFT_1759905 [Mycena galopus ATCC 62051]|nr:hypothetical protein K438DRAFT_1759905 [Mycena galopus ATCC 62051]